MSDERLGHTLLEMQILEKQVTLDGYSISVVVSCSLKFIYMNDVRCNMF